MVIESIIKMVVQIKGYRLMQHQPIDTNETIEK